MRCVRVGYIYIVASRSDMFLKESWSYYWRSTETDRGELFHHIGAQEYSIRSMATLFWKDEKRKGMCYFPNNGSASNALNRTCGVAASVSLNVRLTWEMDG